MTQLLIITNDVHVKALINLIMQMNFNIELVNKKSGATASDYLKNNHQMIKAIIADESFPSGTASRMAKDLQNIDSTIPIVALIDPTSQDYAKKEQQFFAKLGKDKILESLVSTMSEIIKPSSTLGNEYLPLNLELLFELNSIGKDCYIKLGEQKFVKIVNQSDCFNKEDFEKYKAKGINSFYIKSNDIDAILKDFSGNMRTMLDLSMFAKPESLNKLRSKFTEQEDEQILGEIVEALDAAEKKKITFEEASEVSSKSLHLIRKANQKFGQGQEVQNLAKATVLLAMSTIKQAPEINQLFDKTQNQDDNYLNDHSVLLSNVCCQIANLLGWNSRLTHYRLTLASLLHDITLDNAKLARYRGIPELMIEADQYSEDEIKAFLEHPDKIASIVRNFKLIPPDTDLIVAEHHERPDGTGFPHKLNHSKISPLGAVMIVAHDLVSFILSREKQESGNKNEWNMISFLNQHRFLYQNGVFKDIFNAMWKHMVHNT